MKLPKRLTLEQEEFVRTSLYDDIGRVSSSFYPLWATIRIYNRTTPKDNRIKFDQFVRWHTEEMTKWSEENRRRYDLRMNGFYNGYN